MEASKIVYRLKPLSPEQIRRLRAIAGIAEVVEAFGAVSVEHKVGKEHWREFIEQALQRVERGAVKRV